MIVIGLNQTIDRTIHLPVLAAGQVLRASEVAVSPGGKAVNVCRAAMTLGAPVRLVGPFPGPLGCVAVELLRAEGLSVSPVTVSGDLRGTAVYIEADGRTTVVNEPGSALSADEWEEIVTAVDGIVETGGFVAISGSVPPGLDEGAHRTLIELIHARSGVVAVDVTGTRLIEAACAGADLVSPNLLEAEQALGVEKVTSPGANVEIVDLEHLDAADVVMRAGAAATALVELGAGAALVSAGHHGVACRSDDLDVFVPAPTVVAVNPVGAGDTLLGATLVALERGRTLRAAICHGVAHAAASVANPVAGYADPSLVDELAATVCAHVTTDRVP